MASINGSNSADVITGPAGEVNFIYGRGGADSLTGGFLPDVIDGGTGDDTLRGLQGSDVIYGGAGADMIFAGEDDDTVFAGAGSNLVEGGRGDDVIDLRGSTGGDVNTADGGAGDDEILAGLGADDIRGGAGEDWLRYDGLAAGVSLSLKTHTGSAGAAAGDTIRGIENVLGGKFADFITGDGRGNILDGGQGSDVLHGEAGEDILLGGGGSDSLFGGLGADEIDGGSGFDIAVFNAAEAIVVNLATGETSDGDVLISIEGARGGPGDDAFFGSSGGDQLEGTEGEDYLVGAGGADTLYGGAQADIFSFGAGAGSDVIMDFQDGVDKLQLDGGWDWTTFGHAAVDHDGDLTADDLALTTPSGTLTLLNMTWEQLDAGDFF